MTTEEKFKAAVNVIRSLPKNGSYQPSNDLMLRFYGYFKQATEGPCIGKRPPFYQVVAGAKYDAWKKMGGMSRLEAMSKYVEELHSIVETMSYSDKVANFLQTPTNELETINLNDLELIAGDVIDRFRSHPNSPFGSREASPTRSDSLPTPCDDDSDEEYIDTIEYPESGRMLNGNGVNHMSRSRTKYSVDISEDVSKTVQSLRNDIDRMSNKIDSLEDSTQSKRFPLHLIALIVIWPFVAHLIMYRYVIKRK